MVRVAASVMRRITIPQVPPERYCNMASAMQPSVSPM